MIALNMMIDDDLDLDPANLSGCDSVTKYVAGRHIGTRWGKSGIGIYVCHMYTLVILWSTIVIYRYIVYSGIGTRCHQAR